jgi:hypothetical protein
MRFRGPWVATPACARYAGIPENLPGSPTPVVPDICLTADKKAAYISEREGWLRPPQALFALHPRLDLFFPAGTGMGSFCTGGGASSTGVLSSGPSIGSALRVPASGSASS